MKNSVVRSVLRAILSMMCLAIAAVVFPAFAEVNAVPLTLNEEATVSITAGGQIVYYSFIPVESGTYIFSSSGSSDTYGYLYDASLSQITYNDDDGENSNFQIAWQLTAGTHYYFGARYYSSSLTGSFQVLLTKRLNSGSCGDNLTWTLNDGILTISGTGAMTDYDWGNYAPWYTNDSEITQVVIENGVTSIGNCAFLMCNLTSVSIPDSVTSIGDYAFGYCWNLEEIMIPKGVLSIGDKAFFYCELLQAFAVDSQNTYFCAMDDVLFNAGITQLIKYPAAKAGSSYTIPVSVTQINEDAFDSLAHLNWIDVASGNTSFASEDGILFNRAKTILIRYPSCMPGSEYTVPDSIVEICLAAFQGTDIETLYLPRGLEKIGYFWSQNLKDIYYTGTETDWNDIEKDEDLFNDINVHYIPCGDALTWRIEDTVLIIGGNGAMYDFEYPNYNSKTDMLLNADKVEPWYRYRTWIDEIIIQPGVTSIGKYAFYDCFSLTNITIPEGLTIIGNNAFYNCSSLTSVLIPDSATSIGIPFYTNCIVSANHPSLSTVDGVIFSKDGTWLINYPVVKTSPTYTIPSSVTGIGNSAFSNCSNLTSVIIPNSVIGIGIGAFYNCSGLTSIAIPNGVMSISNGAFYGCSGMTSVTIPDSVSSIGVEAFRGCTNLISVTLPNSVTNIGDAAFYECSKLINVTLPDNDETTIGEAAFMYCSGLTDLIIPNGVYYIDSHTFYGCSGLTSVSFPDYLAFIGNYAFNYCSSLNDVKLPGNYLTSIFYEAFGGCRSLSEITIPDSVTEIYDYAFYGCSSLTDVTISKNVTYLGSNLFGGCDQLTLLNCFPGSAVHTYAVENNIPFTLLNVLNFRLPEQTTSVESEAFADIPGLTGVYIPTYCTDIAVDAFGEAEVVIYAPQGSYAETFAEQKGYPFVAMD